MGKTLPPGQKDFGIFPRFGLSQYANRFPKVIDKIELTILGDGLSETLISDEIEALSRVEQISDFHCVTTWSKPNVKWSGYRFKDFYKELIKPMLTAGTEIKYVILHAQDGYKTGLFMEDMMMEDVILADQLDDTPLNIEHGAPLRLVVPAHYGYKNLKHLYKMEFCTEKKKVKQGFLSFMDHPRARVAHEERAVGGPGWFFRYLYRPLIKGTVKDFEKGMKKYYSDKA